MSEPRLRVYADAAATARAAAGFVAECARNAVATRGQCTIAFSGGSTPGAMLAALVAEDLPWPKLQIFQVDERSAARGDEQRNLTQIQSALLGTTPLAAGAVHAMPVENTDLDAGARGYASELAAITGSPPVLDLVHLGLGDDGHTASLVPGDAALAVRDRDVTVSGEYRGYRRMTLTLPVLDRARQRLWLVTGAAKAEMLARLMKHDETIPAGRVRAENSVVFADRAALGEAPGRSELARE